MGNQPVTRKYDSTIARIAGNIASGLVGDDYFTNNLTKERAAVAIAREIVAEVERTQSGVSAPSKE